MWIRARMQFAYTGWLQGTAHSELVELYSSSFNPEDGVYLKLWCHPATLHNVRTQDNCSLNSLYHENLKTLMFQEVCKFTFSFV
jgi:hypothetical protein